MEVKTILFGALALMLTGCDTSQYESVIVGVYPSRQQCGIDKEMMKCGEIAAYLRDTLKIKPERRVVVSAVSSDPLPKNDTSLNKIAVTIRDVGFKDVRTANFDVK
jgi:hypothetical protein